MTTSNQDFQIGDDVSYGFNGDFYPCGQVDRISKTGKVIYSTTGAKFIRQSSGYYKRSQTWTLVHGIHNDQNPHF